MEKEGHIMNRLRFAVTNCDAKVLNVVECMLHVLLFMDVHKRRHEFGYVNVFILGFSQDFDGFLGTII